MATLNHRGLVVWRRGMELVVESYRLAAKLPPYERDGLGSQIRRSAVSVPANIAEGNGRAHRGDHLRHLSIARGSLHELQTLLELGERPEYFSKMDPAIASDFVDQSQRMLTALRRRLRS